MASSSAAPIVESDSLMVDVDQASELNTGTIGSAADLSGYDINGVAFYQTMLANQTAFVGMLLDEATPADVDGGIENVMISAPRITDQQGDDVRTRPRALLRKAQRAPLPAWKMWARKQTRSCCGVGIPSFLARQAAWWLQKMAAWPLPSHWRSS